ncbi:MAG: thiamine biosynthesis protein [Thaumarchaeota archaeon]|nr:thiamine biosynthesis protein [Nitrososphaerota archaeon]MDE1872544.1 thiamine biosynthesis protein [Nitrososphaerota archaeon]
MNEKTVLVVFPSVFSLNKMEDLETNISKILKIKKQSFTCVRKSGSVIVVEANDPVFASSTIGSLFGVDRIAIAKEVKNQFDTVLSTITSTSMNLLLKGEKFYIKVEGRSSDYLAKDLEIAATSSLIEKSVDLQVKPGLESDHSRLLYTYLTESYAYVCIFVDKGLGGIPYNSQKETMLCCIYDELSAITCLQSIKMGFDAKMLISYSGDSDLLKMSKMINRILPSIVQEKITLQFCKMPKTQDPLMKILVMIYLMISIASSRKIKHIALPILPFTLPVWLMEDSTRVVFQKNLMPWIPLAGMDSSILENSRQIGLEKYIVNLENLCKSKFTKRNIPKKKIQKNVSDALKSLKSISLTVGPKNVHDIIDSLRTNH